MSEREVETQKTPPSIHLLLIDHEDSFTFNIKAWLETDPTVQVDIVDWKDSVLGISFCKKFDGIVFSPGPGHPSEYECSRRLLNELPGDLPVIGICLGMQMMVCESGGLLKQVEPVHGAATPLICSDHLLFFGLSNPMVGRYHSLAIDEMASNYRVLATSPEGRPMAVEEKTLKRCGFQFHPESFLTSCGDSLRSNLLTWIMS